MNRDLGNLRTHAMLLCAFIWFLVGLGGIFGVALPAVLIHAHLPVWANVVSCWVPAALAIITSRSNRLSNLGIASLLIMPSLRGLSYVGAWLVEVLGWGVGLPLGWYSAALYGALIGLVYITARIPASLKPRGNDGA